MADTYAHLIVLGGPDGGREIRLDHLPVRVGRSAECQIRLQEEFVSREHFSLTGDAGGIVLDVLSSSGVRIDKKKYRKSKAILLGTGDVVNVGGETGILFVAAGDDPAAALAAVQAARAAEMAARPPQPESLADLPEAVLVDEPTTMVVTAQTGGEPPSAAEADLQRRRQRTRRLVIGFGIYLSVLAAIGIALILWGGDDADGVDDRPATLTAEQVQTLLSREPEGISPNPMEADKALALAQEHYASRHLDAGHPYRCVREYLRYKAFDKRIAFETTLDESQFDTALSEVTDSFLPLYQQALQEVAQGRWNEAHDRLGEARTLIPYQDDPINRNCQEWLKYVNDRIRTTKKRRPRLGM